MPPEISTPRNDRPSRLPPPPIKHTVRVRLELRDSRRDIEREADAAAACASGTGGGVNVAVLAVAAAPRPRILRPGGVAPGAPPCATAAVAAASPTRPGPHGPSTARRRCRRPVGRSGPVGPQRVLPRGDTTQWWAPPATPSSSARHTKAPAAVLRPPKRVGGVGEWPPGGGGVSHGRHRGTRPVGHASVPRNHGRSAAAADGGGLALPVPASNHPPRLRHARVQLRLLAVTATFASSSQLTPPPAPSPRCARPPDRRRRCRPTPPVAVGGTGVRRSAAAAPTVSARHLPRRSATTARGATAPHANATRQKRRPYRARGR